MGEQDRPSDASTTMQRQRLAQMIQEMLKDAKPETADRAAKEFLNHLRETSPIAADKVASGQMDEDELRSRVDVYLRDHPEITGKTPESAIGSPRARVAELLRSEQGVGSTDSERMAAADRFIERLGEISGTARDSLVAGTMTNEELQSRVKVFAADLRAESTAVAVDPAIASVPPIVDAFLKANLGNAAERPNSLCFRGVIEEKGAKRGFVIFKKRPGMIRIHIIETNLVIGIVAYDGTNVWRQARGQSAIPVVGSDAESVVIASRYDHPLVDYRERGTVVRLEARTGNQPIQLHIRETDGTEMTSTIDPVTYAELSMRVRGSDGRWQESKFREYHRVGTLNLPYVQELWSDGGLKSTTRITDVSLDPGLLDEFFARPTSVNMSFMSYMDALDLVQAAEKKATASLSQPVKANP
jgi:hypothetical protein